MLYTTQRLMGRERREGWRRKGEGGRGKEWLEGEGRWEGEGRGGIEQESYEVVCGKEIRRYVGEWREE
jgi:hypothetical protein